jgi:hypothetical protein
VRARLLLLFIGAVLSAACSGRERSRPEIWNVLSTNYKVFNVTTGIIPGDQYTEKLCQGFTMSEANLRKFLQRARSISPDELHDKFEGAPCFVKASLTNGKHGAVLEVRASGLGSLELDGAAPIDIGCDTCDDLLAEKLP